MKISLIAMIFTLLSLLSAGQDSIRVIRQYERDKPANHLDSAFNSIPNTMFLSLDEGFDDSVRVTVNEELIFEGYLKTNESIGLAKSLIISFKDPTEIKILKVLFVKANRYILEKLDLNYKSLQVRGLNPWLLIYTNHFPMRM